MAIRTMNVVLASLALASATLLFWPGARDKIHNWLRTERRHVLSVVEGQWGEHFYKVVKIRSAEGILLEIHRLGDQAQLIGRWPLKAPRDGFFHFHGQAANLALDDLNHDGFPEIMVPSFEPGWQPKMNIFSFDPQSGQIESYAPSP